MKKAPDKLNNWPSNLRHVFDKNNPRASHALILMSYESFSGRIVGTTHDEEEEKDVFFALAKPQICV